MKVGVAFAQKKKPSSLKIQERITEGYVLLLLTLFLFAVPQEGYVNIISMKYGLFLCLCGGYVLISLVIQCEYLGLSGILAGVKKCTPKKLWKNYPLHSLIFAYLCFTTISALCSPYDGTFFGKFRQEGVLSLWIYGLCCGLVALYYRPKELHLWICGLSACLFCIFGWIQLLGGNPLTLFPEPYHYFHSNVFYSGTYWSTIGNVNLCAVVLCSWVAVFGVTLIRCTGKNIYLATIPLFLAVISAFALGSSSSILAIALGLLLLLPLTVENVKMFLRWFLVCGICGIGAGVGVVPHFSHPTIISMVLMISIFLIITYFTLMYSPLQKKLPLTHSFHKELYLLVAGFLILLLAILYFVPFSSGVLFQIHEILHGRGEDGFGTGRLFIWRGVWDLILENPWLGGGADTLGDRKSVV